MLDDVTADLPHRDPFEVIEPRRQTLPLVIASPHSGSDYPADFIAGSVLDPQALRRSEDCFVDTIFGSAPELGAPLLKALFPRAYIDPNREPFELDPAMFEDPLPAHTNTRSPRVAAGLGTIARVVAGGAEIYRGKLRYAEAEHRIETFYRPYHAALGRLIERTRERFGRCVLIDCHSMPSIGGPNESDAGETRVDFVLGDCFGTSCAPELTNAAEAFLKARDFVVTRNDPYAGGYTTRHYGRPADGVHVLQIEINRTLYMDEAQYRPKPFLETLAQHAGGLLSHLGAVAQEAL